MALARRTVQQLRVEASIERIKVVMFSTHTFVKLQSVCTRLMNESVSQGHFHAYTPLKSVLHFTLLNYSGA